MQYNNIYNDLIESRKLKTTSSDYHEMHHIIPKCMGGSNRTENLVKLTAREHYIAHWLLVKVHPDNKSLKYAFFRSAVGNEHTRKLTSRQCERARKSASEARKGFKHSAEAVEKMKKRKGFKHSEESKKKIGEAARNRRHSPETIEKLRILGTNISDETRRKRSKTVTGQKRSAESRHKMSESAKRKPPQSLETRAKISAALKGKPKRKSKIIKDDISLIDVSSSVVDVLLSENTSVSS